MALFKSRKPPKQLASITVIVDSARARSVLFKMLGENSHGNAADQARILGCLSAWAETYSFGRRSGAGAFADALPGVLIAANTLVDEAEAWDGIEALPDWVVSDPIPPGASLEGMLFISPENQVYGSWTWMARNGTLDPIAMMVGLCTLYEQALSQMASAESCSILFMAMQVLVTIIQRDPSEFASAESTAIAVAKMFDIAIDLVAGQLEP